MERKIYLYDRGFWVLFRMLHFRGGDCTPDAQPMHEEALGQAEKTFPLSAGRIRGLFQLNLANRQNNVVRIPCSFTKQAGEIRAYFAGVYALEEVR